MQIETLEGDFVIRGSYKDIIRAHFTEDSLIVTMGPQVVVVGLEEAKALRDWIDRRLNEPLYESEQSSHGYGESPDR
jgi:hypothetical protein